MTRSELLLRMGIGFILGAMSMWELRASDDDVVANVVLGIHGGTGLDKKDMTPELDKQLRAVLTEALQIGKARLDATGNALDGVEAAIRVLEDSPLLNAGKGAVFTREGRNELDASIMDGRNKAAGSVAGVTVVKNPITAARAVMEKSKHVLLTGRGAEIFATKQGLEIVDPSYFWTESRWKDIQKVWKADEERAKQGTSDIREAKPAHIQFGTVGAVARDRQANLAAGTSTGGMTGKLYGRVGDSPIIGAGTYADNTTAAISCTGHGEFFIRYAVAHEIVSQIKYKGVSLEAAAHDVINQQLKSANGEGAAIGLDKQGRFAAAYNSEGLYRGSITAEGVIRVRLYED